MSNSRRINYLSPFLREIAFVTNKEIRSNPEIPSLFQTRMKPAIFEVDMIDGKSRIGWHYAPLSAVPGDKAHYDHGVGGEKNKDLTYVWVSPLTAYHLKKMFDNPHEIRINSEALKGIFTMKDGTSVIGSLNADSSRIDVPARYSFNGKFVDRDFLDNILEISPMPQPNSEIWSGNDTTPAAEEIILTYTGHNGVGVRHPEKEADQWSEKRWSKEIFLHKINNYLYQGYKGPWAGTTPWKAISQWATPNELFDYVVAGAYTSMLALDNYSENKSDIDLSQTI